MSSSITPRLEAVGGAMELRPKLWSPLPPTNRAALARSSARPRRRPSHCGLGADGEAAAAAVAGKMETVEQLVSFHRVQVQLSGGAPWGFTLKGGTEHGEPLVITKIEEGGKAARCEKLKVGDELININGSALYGSRQEALILIKGSYRILKLGIRSEKKERGKGGSTVGLSKPCAGSLSPSPPGGRGSRRVQRKEELDPRTRSQRLHCSDVESERVELDICLRMLLARRSVCVSSAHRPLLPNRLCRRSIPHIRPASWLLSALSELPPPPPPPPPLLPHPADSPPLPPPPTPPAMQLHPCACPLTWNTSENSDLPTQWGQLCRPYSSTDRSSSLGSMESLDTAAPITQPYSDSHNSPVDPALFNSKRDSAYSSFSASSNMSDYAAVPLRPGDVCSMDNFLQSLGPPCPNSAAADGGSSAEGQRAVFKFRSLTRPRQRPVEVKERPSSCSYEEDRRGGDFDVIRNGECAIEAQTNPTQPSNRMDSFKNTPSCPNPPNKRRASAPTDISYEENVPSPNSELGIHNGFIKVGEGSQTGHVERHYSVNQTEEHACDLRDGADTTTDQLSRVTLASAGPPSLTSQASLEFHERSQITHSVSAGLHWPNDPEKTQLQFLRFKNNNSSPEPYSQSYPSESCSSQWSPGPIASQGPSNSHCLEPANKWGESCCSTPGSVFLEEGMGVIKHHHPWGRSVSVPEEPDGPSTQARLGSDQILGNFEPLRAAASVDTLLEEQRTGERTRGEDKLKDNAAVDATKRKPNSSRNHRRNRRRNERFATNLRNEIQRKKAQLQRSGGPGGLLSCGETVQEEEGADLYEESGDPDTEVKERGTKVLLDSPVDSTKCTSAPDEKLITSNKINGDNSHTTAAIQIVDSGVPNFGVGVRVVEEPAPAGKARRWRWTPEHKLQPEPKPSRLYGVIGESVLGVTQSRQGVCAFTSASTSSCGRSASCSRMEESDILPFADRRKFFEETSKLVAGSKVSGLSSHKSQEGEHGQYTNQRRYSYQGGLHQELPSGSTSRDRQQESEWGESARERKRDNMLREREMQQEKERWERKVEKERLREKEQQERVRRWEREREMELELERAREEEHLQKEREEELGRERKEFNSRSCMEGRNHDENSHPSRSSQVPPSAFYPVNQPSRPTLYQGLAARSNTPTQLQYPARQHETSKLNRKYSLTERDYTDWRQECQPPDGIGLHHRPSHQASRTARQVVGDRSDCNGHTAAPLSQRGRAMSENDLHFDGGQRWSPSHSAGAGQTLSEVEEGVEHLLTQKKKKPPPRPPPPKWEQFHRRRASHHTLFPSSSTVPPQHPNTPPPSVERHTSAHSTSEQSRQRSYSLPPQGQEVAESCPRCSCNQPRTREHAFAHVPSDRRQFPELSFSVAPPSPMFSRRAFGSAVPTYFDQHEREIPPPPAPWSSVSEADSSHNKMWNPHKPSPSVRPGAEWERTLSPRIQINNMLPPALANGHLGGVLPPESYSALDDKQQQQMCVGEDVQSGEPSKVPETGTESETTLSPSPTHSLEAELDVPLETDIDDFQGDDGLPVEEELPCFALPVTVLETDIDTLPEPRAEPVGGVRAEEEELESSREGLSLDELFPHSSEGESGTESWRGAFHNPEHNSDSLDSTSAAKAQLLSQMKDLTDNKEREDDDELTYKRQLMESLRKKLGVLREAQRGLQDDVRANAQLGEEVESMVVAVCKPNEVAKFRMFIGDLDKVVSLLLSLSGRLLRAETTLDTLNPDTDDDERLSLLEKKRQLMRQLSEAQDLKEHVDHREQAVSRVLARCLSPEQHRDYSHFVKMKAALLVEQKQLEDKIRLGEEQLRGLRESLGLGLGLGLGLSVGYGHY
ncbi:protein Shroom4 isoform X2 [Phyllopteryx taeniolatus]|uniref:protein Shroom4 isoform X2 n=1 Tax=Phyllopteryx taeniolatus TaxID=161469 RepID=UPI002AD3518D|nr:protein Shroom4 isoform X2 [Phyllopteryx taeniolatus]